MEHGESKGVGKRPKNNIARPASQKNKEAGRVPGPGLKKTVWIISLCATASVRR